MSVAEQFAGLDMKSLIGGPLTAAADASILLARSTADFINDVGFDANGKVRTNVLFDMEVKQSEKSEKSTDLGAFLSGSAKFGPVKVSITGSVSSHSSNTRSSDNSAKYHVDVRATNHGMPEGLARAQAALLNRCLNDYPRGVIIGKDIAVGRYMIGEHELTMEKITYHIGFSRRPTWEEAG